MTKSEFLATASGQKFIAGMRLTGLRPVTINNYARRVAVVSHTLNKAPESLSVTDVKAFLVQVMPAGYTTINAATTCVALKFYISRTLGKPWENFQFPKINVYAKRRARPLTRDEIKQLLDRTRSIRFRLLFALIYGSGLRLGEACHLKVSDIDLHSFKVYIRDGKGGQNRSTVLSRSLARDLQKYIADRRPGEWLFPSNRRTYEADTLFPIVAQTKVISNRSAQREFDLARGKLNLAGWVTIHSLRHSFATHLVEYSMPIFSVQRLLGHRHLRTTLGYLSSMGMPVVADFSPLDRIALHENLIANLQ